jgi:Zn-dependent protease with chaperone function
MHPLLGLGSLVGILVVGALTLRALPRMHNWSRRRDLELLILVAPAASFGITIAELRFAAGTTCFLGPLPLDYRVNVVLALAMGVGVVLGLAGGISRPLVFWYTVARRGVAGDIALTTRVDRLARELGVAPPRLLLYPHRRPLALVYGVRSPTLFLSTWMVRELDAEELAAVVAHELAHVARHDYAVGWLATVLRDTFWYLPTSRIAYRRLQAEKEPACDDVAVSLTERPLALASALAKVWHLAASGVDTGLAQALTAVHKSTETRITRLLAGHQLPAPRGEPAGRVRVVGTLAIAGLAGLTVLNLLVLVSPMGCGAAMPLSKLF